MAKWEVMFGEVGVMIMVAVDSSAAMATTRKNVEMGARVMVAEVGGFKESEVVA
jgi:hypothetical protein